MVTLQSNNKADSRAALEILLGALLKGEISLGALQTHKDNPVVLTAMLREIGIDPPPAGFVTAFSTVNFPAVMNADFGLQSVVANT